MRLKRGPLVRTLRCLGAVARELIPERGGPGGPSVPILVYHRVVDRVGDVSPESFRDQMQALADEGWRTITMTALGDAYASGEVPARTVALTVDDGTGDALDGIVPALQEHGFVATFYPVPGRVGNGSHMAWQEMAAIQAAGMEIGNHTLDHLDLATLAPAEVERQIREAHARLVGELAVPPRTIAYPFGSGPDAALTTARALGYGLGRVTVRGCSTPSSDRMRLPVVLSVQGHDTSRSVLRAVARCVPPEPRLGQLRQLRRG